MFEGNPQPLFVFERATLAFLEANEAALHQYGYSREEMLETTLEAIWPPEDVARNRGRVEGFVGLPIPLLREAQAKGRHGLRRRAPRAQPLPRFGSRVANLVLVNDVTRAPPRRGTRATDRRGAVRPPRPTPSILAIVIAALDGRILDVNHELTCDLLRVRSDRAPERERRLVGAHSP